MPETLNRREKIILLSVIMLVILAIGFRTLVAPVLARNAVLDTEIKITRLKLKKYLGLLNQKEELKNAYAKLSRVSVTPQEGQATSTGILSDIENLANDSGLYIIDIRPEPRKNTASKENYVQLRTEGEMESYLKFIYSIENSLRLLQVKKLQLQAKNGSSRLEGNFLISQAITQ